MSSRQIRCPDLYLDTPKDTEDTEGGLPPSTHRHACSIQNWLFKHIIHEQFAEWAVIAIVLRPAGAVAGFDRLASLGRGQL